MVSLGEDPSLTGRSWLPGLGLAAPSQPFCLRSWKTEGDKNNCPWSHHAGVMVHPHPAENCWGMFSLVSKTMGASRFRGELVLVAQESPTQKSRLKVMAVTWVEGFSLPLGLPRPPVLTVPPVPFLQRPEPGLGKGPRNRDNPKAKMAQKVTWLWLGGISGSGNDSSGCSDPCSPPLSPPPCPPWVSSLVPA